MKVFRVVHERDGMTTKEPGATKTQLLRQELLYAADTIEDVLNEIQWLRQDPEVTVLAVEEAAPAISIVKPIVP